MNSYEGKLERQNKSLIRVRKFSQSLTKNENLIESSKPRSGSLFIYEYGEKQYQVNLKNDKEFFDANKITSNLNKIKKSIELSNPPLLNKRNSIDSRKSIRGKLNEYKKKASKGSLENMINYSSSPTSGMNKTRSLNKVDEETIEVPEPDEENADEAKENIIALERSIKAKNMNSQNTQEFLNNKLDKYKSPDSQAIVENEEIYEIAKSIKNQALSNLSSEKSKYVIDRTSKKHSPIIKIGSNPVDNYVDGECDSPNMERLEDNSSNFPYRICFICDRFIQKVMICTAFGCYHSFCKKCGKTFYEEKIEQGDTEFKCPVHRCTKPIMADVIKLLVSEKHFNVLEGKEEKLKSSISENVVLKQNFLNHIESVKLYTNKHVLDVNSNENFFMFNKAKDQFCIKCSEPALFGKNGGHYVKCLNCFHSICKYCMKSFTANHLEISSHNYCRVYFRRNLRRMQSTKTQHCKNYLLAIVMMIASYIMIFFATYKYAYIILGKCLSVNQFSSRLKTLLLYFLVILVSLIMTTLNLLFLPYCPVVLTIFQ